MDSNNDSLVVGLLHSSDHGNSRLGALSTDVLKSVLLISLLAITLISSLIPFALRRAVINHATSIRRHIYVNVFSLLSCFGGGVFLATCLLDLLPDTRELIGDGLERLRVKTDFPLSEFLVAIGFFLVLFIEQIVLWFREQQQTRKDRDAANDDDQRQAVVGDQDEEAASISTRIGQRRHTLPSAAPLGTIENVPVSRNSRYRGHGKRKISSSRGAKGVENVLVSERTIQEEVEGGSGLQDSSTIATLNSPADSEPNGSGNYDTTEDADSIRDDVHFDPESHSTFRAIMLVTALSCHSTFEGLALGLQIDPAMALQIFGALCIHKCVIAFSLGMRLVQSRLTNVAIIGCCLLFCVSAVIGGFIGLAITDSVKSSSASMINGSLQGLACGTFLYITAFEILPHELNDGDYRLPKLLMLIFGFAVICVFVLLYPS